MKKGVAIRGCLLLDASSDVRSDLDLMLIAFAYNATLCGHYCTPRDRHIQREQICLFAIRVRQMLTVQPGFYQFLRGFGLSTDFIILNPYVRLKWCVVRIKYHLLVCNTTVVKMIVADDYPPQSSLHHTLVICRC
jgi:hypothetical protein